MDEAFLLDLMSQWVTLAQQIARSKIKSQRIAEALETSLELVGQDVAGKLTVPFYWAIYYHDGRGSIRAKPGHFLVFFKNPDDDPRIGGSARNYPVKRTDVRRLSKDEFFRGLREGKIIATKRVGPAKAHPFFTEGMRSFPRRAGLLAKRLMSKYVRESLEAEGLLRVRRTVTIRL